MDIHNLHIPSLIKVNIDQGRITPTQLGFGIDLLNSSVSRCYRILCFLPTLYTFTLMILESDSYAKESDPFLFYHINSPLLPFCPTHALVTMKALFRPVLWNATHPLTAGLILKSQWGRFRFSIKSSNISLLLWLFTTIKFFILEYLFW